MVSHPATKCSLSSRGVVRLSARHCTFVFTMVATMVVVSSQVAFAATPTAVIARKGVSEIQPSASDDYVVWSQNSAEHPRHFNSYVTTSGERKIRLNEAGTMSFAAGIEGPLVLYQSEGPKGSDLRLYDLTRGQRTNPGTTVNTKYVEYQPNISTEHYFFGRGKFWGASPWARLILYDRSTGRSRVVAEMDPRRGYIDSNQVNGDWVVWERCHFGDDRYFNCDVFRYQISTRDTLRLPNPGKQQYGSSVTANGTVYFLRTGVSDYWRCGAGTKIIRHPVDGPETVIASLARGRDAYATFSLEGAYDTASIYFDRRICKQGEIGDIFKVEDALAT